METSQYLDLFIEESKEHIQSCNQKLLLLEKEPANLSYINEIFRSAHTLKGMSATMGFNHIADLTHQLENVLDEIRNEKLSVTSHIIDILFEAIDLLEAMLISIEEQEEVGDFELTDIISNLKELLSQGKTTTSNESEEKPYDDYSTKVIQEAEVQGFNVFKITIDLQEDCSLKAARVFMIFEYLQQIGEVLSSTPSVEMLQEEQFDHHFTVTLVTNDMDQEVQNGILNISEIKSVQIDQVNSEELSSIEKNVSKSESKKSKKTTGQATSNISINVNKTIRVNIDRLDKLMNLLEELVIKRGRLEQISTQLNNSNLQETVEGITRTSSDLQEIILNMRMIPIETVFNRFPKMVRKLSKELNKEVQLYITGAETELDRTVIEEISDPLVHLIRNALDHGIEPPLERKKAGKKEQGSLALTAFHNGNHVVVEISDDGAGINQKKVLDKAIDREIISKEQAEKMSHHQVFDLIFSSGFSTAQQVSDVSGRGVGLDVVKNTIESLGGTISITSEIGKGSTFSVQLPLTLSIISVMLIQLNKEKYAIPITTIIESIVISKEKVMDSRNQRVIDYRGTIVPLINLHEVFNIPKKKNEEDQLSIVIVQKGKKLAGLLVDRFVGHQEVVLKSLGEYLKDASAFQGATILGDGEVVLIIDCHSLIL
ncbi:chemotaxis protein CheA [Bacillus carboniphilus]|uniref:Chemotaxis protein CheA n=1 Tax=Bacillus carboniphilus TaxID=86663 RepID=A0ABY9JVT7_9BACI|nr:chemotaxis protein CheA [Bacillus carboniphilus]WLR43522.1 chemotaxis protein CheA [Bacillus carboniphilus]